MVGYASADVSRDSFFMHLIQLDETVDFVVIRGRGFVMRMFAVIKVSLFAIAEA